MNIKQSIDDAFALAEGKIKSSYVKQGLVLVSELVDMELNLNPTIAGNDIKNILQQLFTAIQGKTSNLSLQLMLSFVEQLVLSVIPAL